MHITDTLKTFTLAALAALATVPATAQDLLARQAPVDKRMKAVDTLAFRDILQKEDYEMPGSALYTEWSNKYTHRISQLPDSFRIDLRGFAMPTSSRVITSQYGRRWGRAHKGLDIKVYIGDTIRAAFDGKVRIVAYEGAGYGKYVVIRHNNGLETIYGHMSKHLVAENQHVRAGDPIGLGGNTGRSTGSHLHFETRLCGVDINPALLFDFRNQDVTGDYYIYRKRTHSRESARANTTTGRKQDSYSPEEVHSNSAVRRSSGTSTAQRATAKTRDARYHKVARGETLYSIARKRGISVDELCRLNRIGKNMRVRQGQILRYS